jgi:fatty acid desaturase
MSFLLLHGEYDLNHHRHPEISWYYLPRIAPTDATQPNYIKQYWRQWLGPRLATEPEPVTVQPRVQP